MISLIITFICMVAFFTFVVRVIDVKSNYFITKRFKGYKYALIVFSALLYPISILALILVIGYFLYKGKI